MKRAGGAFAGFWRTRRGHFLHARRYLARHPAQTILSGIGVCFSLVLLTLTHASRRGTHEAMMAEFAGLGSNSALVYVHESRPLPRRFYDGLEDLCRAREWAFVPVFEETLFANVSGNPQHTRALYTTAAFLEHFRPVRAWGHALRSEDARLARTMVGDDLARRLQISPENPYIKLDEEWFQVTGTVTGLSAGGSQIHQFLDITLATIVTRPLDHLIQAERPLKFILIRTADRGQIRDLQRAFPAFLEAQQLSALRLDLRLPLRQGALRARSEQLLLAHGGLVTAVCLALSCLGILISYQLQVSYRHEEFGTLVALGASRGHIGWNLFCEVLLLTITSGGSGLLIGITLGLGWSWWGSAAMSIHPLDLAQSLAVLTSVALATGLVPALLALRLNPIDLLRLNR